MTEYMLQWRKVGTIRWHELSVMGNSAEVADLMQRLEDGGHEVTCAMGGVPAYATQPVEPMQIVE